MIECEECYSDDNRATPLIKKEECLRKHTQYICSKCGRCICFESDPKRNLQRWNFPFKSFKNAKLYLRRADFKKQQTCSIYEIVNLSKRKIHQFLRN